jgi:hypothetical protein
VPNRLGTLAEPARGAVEADLRDQVGIALLHLEEPTYRERLARLTQRSSDAAPGVSGDTDAWAGKIVAARNGFAHQLANAESREGRAEEDIVMMQSETLASRLQLHQPYLEFRRQALEWVPDLYAEETARRPSET